MKAGGALLGLKPKEEEKKQLIAPQVLEEAMFDLDLTMYETEEDSKLNLKYFTHCEKVNDLKHITKRNRAKSNV